MIRFSWEASQIVRIVLHIEKQNSFHYLGCHHIWEIIHAGVIYVASIDSHGVQWTCTLFTTLPCQGEVRSKKNVKLFLIWILILHRTVWHQFGKSLTIFQNLTPVTLRIAKNETVDLLAITRELDVSDMSNYTFSDSRTRRLRYVKLYNFWIVMSWGIH